MPFCNSTTFRLAGFTALLLILAVILYESSQARGQPGVAEEWFRRATAPGATVEVMRGAYLGLGDVRLAQGDVVGALASYQESLVAATPGDSLSQRAMEKINALGRAADGPLDPPE